MSKQFNYFALEKDELFICETLFKVFGQICVFPKRTPVELKVPSRIIKPEELLLEKTGDDMLLVQPELVESVVWEEVLGAGYWANLRESPILQYLPSGMLTSTTVKAGRIAYFYKGNSDLDAKVTKLFRELRKRSQKVPESAFFWIFEQAAKEAKLLQPWVGDPKSNLLFTQKQ